MKRPPPDARVPVDPPGKCSLAVLERQYCQPVQLLNAWVGVYAFHYNGRWSEFPITLCEYDAPAGEAEALLATPDYLLKARTEFLRSVTIRERA